MASKFQDNVQLINWKLVQKITLGQQQPNTYRIKGTGWKERQQICRKGYENYRPSEPKHLFPALTVMGTTTMNRADLVTAVQERWELTVYSLKKISRWSEVQETQEDKSGQLFNLKTKLNGDI